MLTPALNFHISSPVPQWRSALEWSRIGSKGRLLLSFLTAKLYKPKHLGQHFQDTSSFLKRTLGFSTKKIQSCSVGVYGKAEEGVPAWRQRQPGKWVQAVIFSEMFSCAALQEQGPALADVLLGNVVRPGKRK